MSYGLPLLCEDLQNGILEYIKRLETEYQMGQKKGIGSVLYISLIPEKLHEPCESADLSFPWDILENENMRVLIYIHEEHFAFALRSVYEDFKFFGHYLSILDFAGVENEGVRNLIKEFVQFGDRYVIGSVVFDMFYENEGMYSEEDIKKIMKRFDQVRAMVNEFRCILTDDVFKQWEEEGEDVEDVEEMGRKLEQE
jgi:hypothetical protein